MGMLGGREDARSREDGGCSEFDELDIELDLGEEKLDLGEEKEEEVESFLDPGGELQREPRGETETPESQLSFLLKLPPPRPATWNDHKSPTLLVTILPPRESHSLPQIRGKVEPSLSLSSSSILKIVCIFVVIIFSIIVKINWIETM